MANNEKSTKWYIYHVEDGKVVMDEAQSHIHLEQHRASEGLPAPRYIAGTLSPMDPGTLDKLAKAAGATVSTEARKALPAYVPPPPRKQEEPFNGRLFRARAAKERLASK